jgi:hypothetical protein
MSTEQGVEEIRREVCSSLDPTYNDSIIMTLPCFLSMNSHRDVYRDVRKCYVHQRIVLSEILDAHGFYKDGCFVSGGR